MKRPILHIPIKAQPPEVAETERLLALVEKHKRQRKLEEAES